MDLIHAPPVASASIVARYPAHLHIDLLPRIQRQGQSAGACIGELIDELAVAASRDCISMSAATTPGAIAFYRRLGFVDLVRGSDSIFIGRGRATRP